MNRKKRMWGTIIISMILVCAVLFFVTAKNQKIISEDAVLVRAYQMWDDSRV